jgi:hypothetical protein
VAQPLLTPAEAAVEAASFGWGEAAGEIRGEFGALDEVRYDLYTHHMVITSGPEHLCRHYLVRIAR